MNQSTADILAYLYLLGRTIFRPRVEAFDGAGSAGDAAALLLESLTTLRRLVAFDF
jgi:hypothetical protein